MEKIQLTKFEARVLKDDEPGKREWLMGQKALASVWRVDFTTEGWVDPRFTEVVRRLPELTEEIREETAA